MAAAGQTASRRGDVGPAKVASVGRSVEQSSASHGLVSETQGVSESASAVADSSRVGPAVAEEQAHRSRRGSEDPACEIVAKALLVLPGHRKHPRPVHLAKQKMSNLVCHDPNLLIDRPVFIDHDDLAVPAIVDAPDPSVHFHHHHFDANGGQGRPVADQGANLGTDLSHGTPEFMATASGRRSGGPAAPARPFRNLDAA